MILFHSFLQFLSLIFVSRSVCSPAVAFHSSGVSISVNFGQQPFLFSTAGVYLPPPCSLSSTELERAFVLRKEKYMKAKISLDQARAQEDEIAARALLQRTTGERRFCHSFLSFACVALLISLFVALFVCLLVCWIVVCCWCCFH